MQTYLRLLPNCLLVDFENLFLQAGEHGSVSKIEDFLRQDLKLDPSVCSVIREEKIDANVVLVCSRDELASLGIEKLGDQKRLILFARAAIAKDVAAADRRADIMEDGK